MRKSKNYLKSSIFLIPFLLLTVGCGDHPSSSPSSSVTNNVSWDEKVDDVLYKAVGDYYTFIPVFEADRYDARLLQQDEMKIAAIACYTNDYLSAENTYSVVLKLNGFSANQYEEDGATYSIATRRVSSTQMLVLEYESGLDNKNGYLGIFAYLYEDRLASWPSNRIINDIGQDIPKCEAEYYRYGSQEYNGIKIAIIACYGIENPEEAVQNYLSVLKSNSYESQFVENAYYCTNDETGLEVDFYYDYDEDFMYIQAYEMPDSNDWPEETLKEICSVDIPKYIEEGTRYSSGYAQEGIYEIICSNASPSSEAVYKKTLEDNGWTWREEYDYETWGYIFIINEGEENEYQIQFYYVEQRMALIINILI